MHQISNTQRFTCLYIAHTQLCTRHLHISILSIKIINRLLRDSAALMRPLNCRFMRIPSSRPRFLHRGPQLDARRRCRCPRRSRRNILKIALTCKLGTRGTGMKGEWAYPHDTYLPRFERQPDLRGLRHSSFSRHVVSWCRSWLPRRLQLLVLLVVCGVVLRARCRREARIQHPGNCPC